MFYTITKASSDALGLKVNSRNGINLEDRLRYFLKTIAQKGTDSYKMYLVVMLRRHLHLRRVFKSVLSKKFLSNRSEKWKTIYKKLYE